MSGDTPGAQTPPPTDPRDVPETPPDEPKPTPVQDPPAEPDPAPYVVQRVSAAGVTNHE
jgi:hypothetical protein